MKIWLIMVCGGLFTYATRLSFIVLLGKMEIPVWLQRSLRFVPPAVLSAIIFPELLLHTGRLDISFYNGRLVAGLLAILVAWRTRNTLLTILVGMVTLLVLQGIFKF